MLCYFMCNVLPFRIAYVIVWRDDVFYMLLCYQTYLVCILFSMSSLLLYTLIFLCFFCILSYYMLASKKFSNLYYCELVMQSIDKEIFSEFLSSCVEDPLVHSTSLHKIYKHTWKALNDNVTCYVAGSHIQELEIDQQKKTPPSKTPLGGKGKESPDRPQQEEALPPTALLRLEASTKQHDRTQQKEILSSKTLLKPKDDAEPPGLLQRKKASPSKAQLGAEGEGDTALYTVEAECELLYKVDWSGYSLLFCEHLCVRFHILLISMHQWASRKWLQCMKG